jgi:hypothetical protein
LLATAPRSALSRVRPAYRKQAGHGYFVPAPEDDSDDYNQCVDLADAVGNSPWGTVNFQSDCTGLS